MDTSDLIIEYTDDDFAHAIRQLLPKGKYWQEADNTELTNLISGMGSEFKITHDEVQLALLTEFDDTLFGWRLADYRKLMAEHRIVGKVYDSPLTPNLITIDIDASQNYQDMMSAFNKTRLPHTEFHWVLDATASVDDLIVRIGGYQKNVYHTRIGPKPPQPIVNGSANTAPYITVFETYEITINE